MWQISWSVTREDNIAEESLKVGLQIKTILVIKEINRIISVFKKIRALTGYKRNMNLSELRKLS
jgi:hypothetical protein